METLFVVAAASIGDENEVSGHVIATSTLGCMTTSTTMMRDVGLLQLWLCCASSGNDR